ncbi:hypothetical protein DPMN_014675 [Dreissena polymorpha]|uniref:Uncharacterized protein n=1 Tax=Dreissena polymorpha TaxID=45954 RepID=A0A9D4NA42_DREPO|nr:hypothetical protein DPMN_014675 [Dreissena polymorpha]
MAYTRKDEVYHFFPPGHGFAISPRKHMIDALDKKVNNDYLNAVMEYVIDTWINSSVFSVECWSIFMKSVKTNNDCEVWHNRLNTSIAT